MEGYFESEKYFLDFRDEIKNQYKLKQYNNFLNKQNFVPYYIALLQNMYKGLFILNY